jgi:mono/diheme cytochrome c family protein
VTNPRALALSAAVGLAAAAVTFAAITAVDGDEREGAGQRPPPAQARLEPGAGRQLFFEMGCSSCHRFADANSTGTIGPDLDERLAAHDRESLAATIVNPPGSATTGFSPMPEDFGERMTARQLDALVEYLLAARSGP